jgi:hypothetical protein
MLISPTGRANHFTGKDYFMEHLNFWLKYFYDHNGSGTEIN